MHSDTKKLLESVQRGETSVDEALLQLKLSPFEDIGYAKVDLHRKLRQGTAEVIYGAGKTPEQIAGIVAAMQKNGQNRILITSLRKKCPGRWNWITAPFPGWVLWEAFRSRTDWARWSSPPAVPATSPWRRKRP